MIFPSATNHHRHLRLFILLLLATAVSCCGCNVLRNQSAPLPTVLSGTSQLPDIINAVNANSSQMKNFVTNTAKIHITSSPIPLSNCTLAFERPRRFRATGNAAMGGPLFDIGSNDELFWAWTKAGQENAIYYCRHAQYATSQARGIIPIDPDWLIESMGIVDFKPTEQHALLPGSANGNHVIQTTRSTPTGTFKKLTTIDRNTACVLSQSLYGPNNQLVAKADSPGHLVDPNTNIVYPKSVDMTFITAGETFRIHLDLGKVQFNIANPFNSDAFSLPTYAGYTAVDICDPRFNANQAAQTVPPELQQGVKQY